MSYVVKFDRDIRENKVPSDWADRLICLWTEDECLRNDPDAEHLPAAIKRLCGKHHTLGERLDRVDNGDSCLDLYARGWVVYGGFDGSALYRVVTVTPREGGSS